MADNTVKLHDFFISQLKRWPMAAANYAALSGVKTRSLSVDGFPILLQHNPGRIRSTAAKVSPDAIRKRPCFLCRDNRPPEQQALPFVGSTAYEILVNPFPIADEHFTIAAREHIHQDKINPADMEKFVTTYPGYLAFYNGSTAGASAPDHLHFQACRIDFLNGLVSFTAQNPGQLMKHDSHTDIYAMPELPMQVVHFVSDSIDSEMQLWLKSLVPPHGDDMMPAAGMRNIVMWRDAEQRLHTLLFPRAAHRPTCYFSEGEEQCLVSPGALDMAGVIILPRHEDFETLTVGALRTIYDEVSLDYRSLPILQHLMLL